MSASEPTLAWTAEDEAWLATRRAIRPDSSPGDAPAANPNDDLVLQVLGGGARYTLAAVAELAGLDADATRQALWSLLNAHRLIWEVQRPAVFRPPDAPPDAPLVAATDEVAP